MRKFVLGLCLFGNALFAESQNTPPKVEEPAYHITIGGNYTRAYVKPNANPSFSGNLGGLQGEFEYQKANSFYGSGQFAWRYGHVHASNGKRCFQDIRVQEGLGYTLEVFNPGNLLTFFSGFGYRQFKHDVDLKGMKSVTLRYNDFYVPVGILGEFKVVDYLSLGGSLTWMPQVFTSVKVDPLGGTRWITKREVKNFLAEFDCIFHLDCCVKNLSIGVSPFFEFWQDGSTSAKASSGASLSLPGNSYVFWGGNVNVKYSF